ncbi:unnamed protein product [Didymodactylos carnosus]|uniref:Calcyclin-binding protein n=1 Tax=Didymodactylos carnosus TaxID=1234261 RepID=A0A813VNI0_9BILA|nr:unnamed protein product [Didymodactylos carnosus]CAF3633513.1 unnamed protein product [Didymodactylos carnosus]
MSFDQQIQDLNLDIDEIKKFHEQSQRPRIKQFLEIQLRKYQTELLSLKEKQQQQNDNKTGEKAVSAQASATTSTNRSYNKDITLYAWDQSDKFVKLYVQDLNGVSNLAEDQIKCTFEQRGFQLEINNLNNVNYTFKLRKLLNEILPNESSYKLKKDSVVIMLRKKDPKQWECVIQDDKKADKKLPKMDDRKDPGDSLMNMMKQMYDEGDDEMKRTIAKAWTESREKMNTGGGGEMGGF